MNDETGVIIVGAGLAGLVAAAELVDAGRRVIILEQEPEASLGGQAFWSFGGLFLVNSPEQRRLGIRDSHDLALQDWMASAGAILPTDMATPSRASMSRGEQGQGSSNPLCGGCVRGSGKDWCVYVFAI